MPRKQDEPSPSCLEEKQDACLGQLRTGELRGQEASLGQLQIGELNGPPGDLPVKVQVRPSLQSHSANQTQPIEEEERTAE